MKRRASDVLGRSACAALAGLLIVFHLGTLAAPPSNSGPEDEVELTDYAVHGSSSLWERILPARERFRTKGYPAGLWNGYGRTQGWILRRIGVGGPESKLGGAVCGLLGLLVLASLLRGLGLPWCYPLVMLLFGFTKPFFDLTHSARPEGYVFLAAALNWLWFFRGESRPASLAAGFAATAALVFHSAMILSLAPLLVALALAHGRKLFAGPRFYWWTIGALLGALAAMSLFDGEQAGYYVSLYAGSALQAPPLLRWLGHPLSLVSRAVAYDFFISRQGYAWDFLLCSTLLSFVLLIRGFRRLETSRRRLLEIGLLSLLSFALLQSSGNGANYFVYLEPWLLLALTAGAELLWNGGIEIGLADQVLLAAAHVALFAAILKGFWTLALASFAGALVARAGIPRRPRAYVLAAGGLAAIAVVLWADRLFWEWGAGASYLLSRRPALLALLMGLPWLLMIPDRTSEGRERGIRARFEWIFLAYCLVNFGALVAVQLRDASRALRDNPSEPSPELQARFLQLRNDRRLVAPEQLWFYAPSLSFQAAEAVSGHALRRARVDTARELADYSPDRVLWPVGREAELGGQAASLGGRPSRFIWGPVWRTPSGDWRELHIAGAARRHSSSEVRKRSSGFAPSL